MKAKPLPSLEYLNKCFELSEESPSGLIWKTRPVSHFPNGNRKQWNGRWQGKPAGSIKVTETDRCCWILNLHKSMWQVHRFVYAMHHKVELSPDVEIDHKNTNALDNSVNNLRLATHSDNAKNVAFRSDNTSGFKGVNWSKTGNYWWGEVVHDKKRYRIRGCPTAEKCHELLCELREKLHGEFANHAI